MASEAGTLGELASEHTFMIVLWIGLSLCITVFALRLTIKVICFRRLFEDYLMLLALCIVATIVAVLRTHLADIYLISMPRQNINMSPQALESRLAAAMRTVGIAILLSNIGIWVIKMNFMFIFYRLGHQIRTYTTLWWVAVVVIVACGAIPLGIIPYDCLFEVLASIPVRCSTGSKIGYIYSVYKANVALDVISDFIIIGFPVMILWNTKINLRHKIVLTGIFSLVAFTIAVTIIRGTIFGGAYKSVEEANHKGFDPSWMVFWWVVEIIVSFIIACLASFRSLWSSKRQDSKKQKFEFEKEWAMVLYQERRSPLKSLAAMRTSRAKRNRWDSLLDTLADLDNIVFERDVPEHLCIAVPSGRLTVDFSQFSIVQQPASGANLSHSSHGTSTNDCACLVCPECAKESWASIGECNLPRHAEPLPSYHRPGTAV